MTHLYPLSDNFEQRNLPCGGSHQLLNGGVSRCTLQDLCPRCTSYLLEEGRRMQHLRRGVEMGMGEHTWKPEVLVEILRQTGVLPGNSENSQLGKSEKLEIRS